MVVVKWLDKVEGSGDKKYTPLCGSLYKEEDDYLVSWSGTDPFANTNSFVCSKENNDWVVPEDHYNEEFKKWQVTIHNDQFRSQTLKDKRNTEETCTKCSRFTKFNVIPREGKK